MFYATLADLVVLVHILFVLFIVFGGLAALRRRWLLWYHLPAAVWGVAIELGGWVCPLTHLENHFRRLGGEGGYSGTFFSHKSNYCQRWCFFVTFGMDLTSILTRKEGVKYLTKREYFTLQGAK